MVGIDIVDVFRISRALELYGERFLEKVFTVTEVGYARNRKRVNETLAGRFAAKEAFMKAMGGRLPWREIEVLERKGRPFITFRGKKYEGLSISHERRYAISVMVLAGKDGQDSFREEAR